MAIRRYRYGMHHVHISDTKFGRITPMFFQDVVPGDTWAGRTSALIRMAPMDRPAFISARALTFFFFVPWRIVDENFEDMITGVDQSYRVPTFNIPDGDPDDTLLQAHFGIGPAATSTTYEVSRYYWRAYNKIVNEFFLDQQLQTPNAEDSASIQTAWFPSNDYFAGARDTVQQGPEETVTVTGGEFKVTDLRDAQHRQKFRERRSQYGERYHDLLASMGLNVPDSRLDRPELVGRGRGTVGISEVVSTATTSEADTGTYRGHGITGLSVPFRPRMFLEFGVLMGLVVFRPRLQIVNRVDRQFTSFTREDFFLQELARDTQVAIRVKELRSDSSDGEAVYGYTARDEWLRGARDTIGANMRMSAQSSWTASRDFAADPSIKDVGLVPEFDALFQDQTQGAPRIYMYWDHHIKKQSMVPRRPR